MLTASISVGARVTGLEQKLLTKYIPRVLRTDAANGHNRAIKLLVENQRRIHKQDNGVGEDAQVVTIPCARNPTGIFMGNLDGTDLPADSPAFVYFDKTGFRYKQVGPLLANSGTVIDQFVGTADPDNPDFQEISIRYLKFPQPGA